MLYFEPNEACSGSSHGLPGEKNARASHLILGGNIDCRTYAAVPLFAPAFCFFAVLVLVFLQFKAEIVQSISKHSGNHPPRLERYSLLLLQSLAHA
jgi:hypothetical protein